MEVPLAALFGGWFFERLQEEAPIDLQMMNRQVSEIGKRRLAGTKVVDGKFEPFVREVFQMTNRAFRVFHYPRFRDLKCQRGGRKVELAQQRQQLFGYIGSPEGDRRDVYRHREFGVSRKRAPVGQVRERVRRNLNGEFVDEMRLFGQCDEFVWSGEDPG